MDYKEGTADSQSDGLQVLGVGEPWPIYLEGMEECYILEPLVIRGLNHSVTLGISFLTRNNLKLICTEAKVVCKRLICPRARLVDGGCNRFINLRSGRVWRAIKEQKISTHVWRIPREKISINVVRKRPEEAIGVYAQEECSIPDGMGKYNPVQTDRGVTGDFLIEISDKNEPGLVLPEIFYNFKKKLGCNFVENLNPELLMLKRGQTLGLVTS